MNHDTTALIADDEPLLRERLAALLARTWPAKLVTKMLAAGVSNTAACTVRLISKRWPAFQFAQSARSTWR